MSFVVEVLDSRRFEDEAAARIALRLPGRGAVVITGGTTARRIYGPLAAADAGWGDVEALFSDERCVPPDDAASNYAMARAALLDHVRPGAVHRMKGEVEPGAAAAEYHAVVARALEGDDGIDLALLGMGADCHVAAMFPGSPALEERADLCLPVERPDGLGGLTLTPPALSAVRGILLLVSGAGKAEAVRRAVAGDEPVSSCPARVLADHPNATFVLDEDAASTL
jgi:6-phosphogluconolactonase